MQFLQEKTLFATDLLVIGVFNQSKIILPQIIGSRLAEKILRIIKDNQSAKKAKTITVSPTFENEVKNIAVVGLGKKTDWGANSAREIGGLIIQAAQKQNFKSITVCENLLDFPAELIEGMELANYNFCEYKTKHSLPSQKQIGSVKFLTRNGQKIKNFNRYAQTVKIKTEAVKFTRNLINRPPSQIHPAALADAAKDITNKSDGKIKIKVFDKDGLKEMKAGAILAVAQGSQFEPFLIHLEYAPKISRKTIAIVGKGVTFDSGGLSLKPSEAMEDMKSDMAGAAAVLGVFTALADLDLPVTIHGIIPVVENMISDKSIRVGDIITTLSGKTVEILNTDAEGRLILADALTYAQRQKPDAIVDLATLTGACIVALGEGYAGLMTNNHKLAEEFKNASYKSDEKIWPLPLAKNYTEKMKSDVADLANIHKGKGAGAIMGGLFLQEFVEKKYPFAHLDIAGPSFNKESLNSYTPAGASGFGVRLMIEWLCA